MIEDQVTAARPLVNPPVSFVAVLKMRSGRTRKSIPFATYELADTIGRLSLLDRSVLSYTVEQKGVPA